jgi:hypothetical protein
MNFYVGVHAGGLTGRIIGGGVGHGPQGDRGIICGLSSGARRRLIAYLMDTDFSVPGWWFVTLTYNDVGGASDHRAWHRERKAFWWRLERAGATSLIWKLELKPRQSGPLVGQDRPHWHTAVYWPDAQLRELQGLVKASWEGVRGEASIVDVLPVDCSQGVGPLMSYLGKYIGKGGGKRIQNESTGNWEYVRCQTETGRVWGVNGPVARASSDILTVRPERWDSVCSRVRMISRGKMAQLDPYKRSWAAYGLQAGDVVKAGELLQGALR